MASQNNLDEYAEWGLEDDEWDRYLAKCEEEYAADMRRKLAALPEEAVGQQVRIYDEAHNCPPKPGSPIPHYRRHYTRRDGVCVGSCWVGR